MTRTSHRRTTVNPSPTRSRVTRFGLRFIFALCVFFVTGEVAIRFYWTLRGLSFFRCPAQFHLVHYRKLQPIEKETIRFGDGRFDLLMLGASVLDPRYGRIEKLLPAKLEPLIDGALRVHNVAASAHVSLDSYYKYRHLADKQFDLVLVYHGINEVRANNCPASVFREDYAHYSWYEDMNELEATDATSWLAFPFTAKSLWRRSLSRLGWRHHVPKDMTNMHGSPWIHEGRDIKTRTPFRRNLQDILDLARKKDEKAMIMTFAYLPDPWPPGSSPPLLPTEIWGQPANVIKGIETHNQVIHQLMNENPHVLFVDQRRLIPQERTYFQDICHLSTEGSARFVDNVVDVLAPGGTRLTPQ